MIKIDKKIPIPEDILENKLQNRRNSKYPWAIMVPGDSFFIPMKKTPADTKQIAAKLAYNRSRAYPKEAYVTNYDEKEKGARIWRIKKGGRIKQP